MEKTERNNKVFEEFFKNRDFLIGEYSDGIITKKEFLKKNFKFIKKLDLKPFFDIDGYEKGIYNYQYYNSIAKYYKMMSSENKKGFIKKKEYLELANMYYYKKDISIVKLLEYLNFKNVDSYYIEVKSNKLKDKLYEIVLKDYKYAILHSKSKWVLEVLEKNKIFSETVKKSVIDEYINESYLKHNESKKNC